MQSNKSGAGGWIFIAVVIWLLWHFNINPLSNEVSVFLQKSNCTKINTIEHCRWENFDQITFQVFSETQRVVFWSKNNPWPITKLNSCAVSDKNNWSCISSNDVFGFRDGDYKLSKASKELRVVSKTQWYISSI